MKCTIESIRSIEFTNKRVGCRVEGFIPVADMCLIPDSILKWIHCYEGVKAIPYEDGIFVASWAESNCSERDIYDFNRGARIAESKAKAKIYRFLRRYAEYMSNYFETLSNAYQDVFLKYDHCVDHEESHADMLGSEND